MSINIPPNKRRDVLLRMALADIAAWHLIATCGACRQERVVSIQSLLDRYGHDVTLLCIVPRLRCGFPACRRPPARVRLRSRTPVQPGPPLIDVTLLDARGAP